ncbi:hypothetical protein TIFTF001_019632 [Ficus carica]|uniref:Uncharacterized protein n=1 Tax=Ficus carica TaxID=3494 RepID=A0AA88DJG1_FICCA|nr:hypothetical protein TIFTF001_019632 [Ficus carica]
MKKREKEIDNAKDPMECDKISGVGVGTGPGARIEEPGEIATLELESEMTAKSQRWSWKSTM